MNDTTETGWMVGSGVHGMSLVPLDDTCDPRVWEIVDECERRGMPLVAWVVSPGGWDRPDSPDPDTGMLVVACPRREAAVMCPLAARSLPEGADMYRPLLDALQELTTWLRETERLPVDGWDVTEYDPADRQ